jgi:protein-S-isoprenylcysteine O-methyltransferase Ste14
MLTLPGVALLAGGNLSRGVGELPDGRLPPSTDRRNFWTLDGESLRWLGVLLFVAGGALRIWPVFVLGRRFSGLVAIQPEHTLARESGCSARNSARSATPTAPGRLG